MRVRRVAVSPVVPLLWLLLVAMSPPCADAGGTQGTLDAHWSSMPNERRAALWVVLIDALPPVLAVLARGGAAAGAAVPTLARALARATKLLWTSWAPAKSAVDVALTLVDGGGPGAAAAGFVVLEALIAELQVGGRVRVCVPECAYAFPNARAHSRMRVCIPACAYAFPNARMHSGMRARIPECARAASVN